MQISPSPAPPDRVDTGRGTRAGPGDPSPSTLATPFAALLQRPDRAPCPGAQDALGPGAQLAGAHPKGAPSSTGRATSRAVPGAAHGARAHGAHGALGVHGARVARGGLPSDEGDPGGDPGGCGDGASLSSGAAESAALDTLDALAKSARHAAQLGVPPAWSATHALAASGAAHAAQPGTPPDASAANPGAASSSARRSLEDLLPSLVRKIAWSGDGRSGTLRMEVGSGALQGASFFVEANAGRVHVTLSPPSDLDSAAANAWRARIASRLTARGIDLDAVNLE